MNTPHSVWIKAWVPPPGVKMSQAILFWKIAVLLGDISAFSKSGLCWLYLSLAG